MREFSIEEKYVIDQEIKTLGYEQKVEYKTRYKKAKSEYKFVALTLLFGTIGVPFFYIEFKGVTALEIALVVINFIALIIFGLLIGISSLVGSSTPVSIVLAAFEVLMFWAIYVRNSKQYKIVIDNYNYGRKVYILKDILS